MFSYLSAYSGSVSYSLRQHSEVWHHHAKLRCTNVNSQCAMTDDRFRLASTS